MNPIDTTTTLATLVTRHPHLAPAFDRLGLDYCCGGRRRLTDAIDERGLDHDEVVAALEDAPPTAVAAGESADWTTMAMADLADHLEAVHHTYLRAALPQLGALAEKVVGVHGELHPELDDVATTFGVLRADLEPHLMKEERVLFPMIRELAVATEAPSFHCGTLRNPIAVMAAEHDRAGELLARLRALTDGYSPPEDACGSYRALYDGLAELEADTHLHVHKENNLLFPAAIEAERLAGTGPGPSSTAPTTTR